MESVRFSLVGFGIQQSFAVESGILGFGIRCTAQGIRNSTNDWNPESKFHSQEIRNPLLGISGILETRLVESGILGFGIRNTAQGILNPTNDWNPESKFQ